MKLEEEQLSRQAEAALREAVDEVVEEARRMHGTVVVWEDGAVRRIPADQLPPTKSISPSETNA
ncbi:MAG: hypothetical protein ABFC96_09275 [Thermoguttaceae bacterium]